MATLSGFSSPPSNPNSQFLSPMLQTYLEQQQQQCLQPPKIDPSQEQVEEEEEGGGGTDDSHTNFLIKNLCPIPNPCSSDLSDQNSSNLLHVSFNQDYSCFAAGFDRGFRIYNCDPFREIFRRDFGEGGGVAIVEMLFRFNILAFVGGGRDGPRNFTNKVMIWDDHKNCCLDQLSFRSEVRGVRLRTDRVVIVLEQKIYVYDFSCFKLMHQIETIANPKGLCAVSQTDDFVLVCPGLHKGQVRVEHYASKRSKLILAHDSGIASFALSQDGHLLATASVKGTLVRIFDTDNGNLLQELRRGTDRAQIYSLSFSSPSQWLAVSSDKGTVHVFGLKINLGKSGSEKSDTTAKSELTRTASGSSLSFMKGVLPKYFNSEWSVAKFRLPEGSHFVVGFGQQKHTILILGLDGSFYRCQFDPVAGGEMTRLQYSNFLKPAEESL